MRGFVKIALYVVLAVGVIVFAYLAHHSYGAVLDESNPAAQPLPKNVKLAEKVVEEEQTETKSPFNHEYSLMMTYGVGLFLCVVGLGILIGRDVAGAFGNRAARMIYDDNDTITVRNADYERADTAWSNGDYLGAIQLLREYLVKNPREVHAALRIAEIYEKDMNNHLAAALEYEEVLKHKLNPERWGWTAIKLANIYSGKLNNSDKALALLHRIANEYGQTKAGEKARQRLAHVEEIGDAEAAEEVS